MRTLYFQYHKEKNRGFTAAEFRTECEAAAGCPLPEIFEVYAVTTREIDYPRYLAYAGLGIDVTPKEAPGVVFGAAARAREGKLEISSVEWDSPADRGGLSARDEILAVNGIRANAGVLDRALESARPGDRLRILVSRRSGIHELEVVLERKVERSFRIEPLESPSPLQAAILEDWLKEK
jgi:predicted metalloprotease with PDZ domain